MRFRTNIQNIGLMHKIGRSLSALAKIGVIRLTPEQVYFIIPGNEGRDGVQVWSQVKVSTLFENFRIESNSNNEIWLEINLDALTKVLRSADSSAGTSNDGGGKSNAAALTDADITLKLHKNGNQPIWAFEIKGTSSGKTKPVVILHEINVTILSTKRQAELSEPMCPPPDIHILLPNLGELKTIVSRLSHLADDVTISANHEGTMEFRVKSSKVEVTTKWRNLNIPTSTTATQDEEPHAPDRMFQSTVSIRGLQKFLTSHLIGGAAIACICENYCLIVYVYIGDIHEAGGVLTFFVPAKLVD